MGLSRRTDASSPSGGVRFAQGTYTGDGAATQAIVGIGFQPRFVLIYSQGSVPAPVNAATEGLKTDQDGVNASFWFSGFQTWRYEWDAIVSLDADGFTVGDGSPINNFFNAAGMIYSFMCWG